MSTPETDIPHHLLIVLSQAQRAFERRDLTAFGTINEHLQPVVDAALGWIVALERERDAYRKAKVENDERFMLERDEARRERDLWRQRYDDLAKALDDCRAMALGEIAVMDGPFTGRAEVVAARVEVGRLVRERADLQARLTREAATHAAREGELSRLVADLQGQLRDADATAAGLRAELAARLAEAEVELLDLRSGKDRLIEALGATGEDRRWKWLIAAVWDLRRDLAEALATLANERGAGEPPEPGWVARPRGDLVRWVRYSARPGRTLDVVRQAGDEPGVVRCHWWDREIDKDGDVTATYAEGYAATFREAMRAASEWLRGSS